MITIEVEPDQAIAIVNALRAAADALASLPMRAGAGPDYWTEQAADHRRLADSVLTRVARGPSRPSSSGPDCDGSGPTIVVDRQGFYGARRAVVCSRRVDSVHQAY